MRKFKNFSAIQILREIEFGNFGDSKIAILAVVETLNLNFGRIQPTEISNFYQNQNSTPSKSSK